MPFDQQVTFLYTDDLEAGHRFWGGAMGLEMVLDQGACRIYRTAPNAFVGICRHRGQPADHEAGVWYTLVTDDVERLWANAPAGPPAAPTVLQPPQDNGGLQHPATASAGIPPAMESMPAVPRSGWARVRSDRLASFEVVEGSLSAP